MGKIIFWLILTIIVISVIVNISKPNSIIQGSDNATNFLDNMPTTQDYNSDYPKWSNFPISYYFTDGNICGDYELNRIRKAFKIIQNETREVISFIEANNTGDINIICSKEYKAGESGTYISGEGGYKAQGNEIIEGTIYFSHMGGGKYTGGCFNIPNIEIHEILHTFGLQHSEEPHSIMYPVSGSNTCVLDTIDDETLNILNSIYHFE